MAIEHKNIPDAGRHEPKGISTALDKTVYVSNGLSTGVWRRVGVTDVQGLDVNQTTANLALMTDGLGGVVSQALPSAVNSYGSMVITNNSVAFPIAAASDTTLTSDVDYVAFVGVGAPWSSEHTFGGVTRVANRLKVTVAGDYKLDVWADITGFPSNIAKIAIKYRINGVTFGPRKITEKSNSSGDAGNMTGFGLVTLAANDEVGIAVASTVAGNLTINNLNTTLTLVRAF